MSNDQLRERIAKDTICAAIPAIASGLEYAKELLAAHDASLGRTTRKNKVWAETIEADLLQMENALAMLRSEPKATS